MSLVLKITRELLNTIRVDLDRRHPFAVERIGFIGAGFAKSHDGILALAHSYRPVADDDYIPDRTVGAMMGPNAIRTAMQWALTESVGIFHVHTHGGIGLPWFSPLDLREQVKFMPSFQNVAAHCPHGAIVLSDTAARGRAWLARGAAPVLIKEFVEVGPPLRKWSGS